MTDAAGVSSSTKQISYALKKGLNILWFQLYFAFRVFRLFYLLIADDADTILNEQTQIAACLAASARMIHPLRIAGGTEIALFPKGGAERKHILTMWSGAGKIQS